ncbi:MAG: hypothetical protein HT580_07855 [Dechloromonas sp.]|nr:MAG: hypothetical protein HT580_07855 [Dechloromonas sp.]
MKIVAADWLPYCLPLRRPWQTSRGVLSERHGRLRRLTTDDGRTGWGDCARSRIRHRRSRRHRLRRGMRHLDLAAQGAGLPLNAWLSGRPGSVCCGQRQFWADFHRRPQQPGPGRRRRLYRRQAESRRRPGRRRNRRPAKARRHAAPTLRLRLDANRAWPLATAQRFIAACAGLPIDGLEEPLAAPEPGQLASLQAAAAFPLAIDESIHLLDAHFFRHPPVRRLVLKPARHGGLLASTELALRASASGLEVIITSALESACGIATLAHLAAAVAPDAVHGLATADWLASDIGLSPRVIDGWMRLPKGNGVGFAMEEALH